MGIRRCEVALMCQRVVSQLRNTLRNGASATKRWISRRGKNHSHFAAAKRWYLAAKWHSCAKEPLRSCENFRRGRKAAVKWFRSGDWFSQRGEGFSQRLLRAAKKFSQREAIFAVAYFRLRNFAAQAFSLLLSFFRFLASFFQFSYTSS